MEFLEISTDRAKKILIWNNINRASY